MKLSIVQLREKVPTGSVGDDTHRLRNEPGPSSSMGWTLDYEAGIVTATKGEQTLLVPMANVAFMRPAGEAKKK